MNPEQFAMEGAQEAQQASQQASGGTSILNALLHTEPDESPQEYGELPSWAADFIIGSKKVLNALTGANLNKGTPALFNFARGTFGAVMARQGEESEGDEGWGEPSDDSELRMG